MIHRLRYWILVLLWGVSATGYSQQWTDEMYEKYTYSTYTTYAAFNQSISRPLNAELLEAAIFYETNRQRALNGQPQFKYEPNLRVSAHNHSVDMVTYDFFDHISVVEGRERFGERIRETGLLYTAAAENIALTSIRGTYAKTAKHLVEEMWMSSPGHRKNILNSNYTHLGCGVAFYTEGSTIYVKATQNFIRPQGERSTLSSTTRVNNTYVQPSQPSQPSAPSRPSQTEPYIPDEPTPQQYTQEVQYWTADEIFHANTGFGASYMSDLEKDVLMYLNLARLYPKKFAMLEVMDYEHPEGFGVSEKFQMYKSGLLKKLNAIEPMQPLRPNYEYYESARCWAEESSRHGVRGHERIKCEKLNVAECCSYGVYTAIDIVLQWLIDDGVPTLGHRDLCLRERYSEAGIYHCNHTTEGKVTVLDFK